MQPITNEQLLAIAPDGSPLRLWAESEKIEVSELGEYLEELKIREFNEWLYSNIK